MRRFVDARCPLASHFSDGKFLGKNFNTFTYCVQHSYQGSRARFYSLDLAVSVQKREGHRGRGVKLSIFLHTTKFQFFYPPTERFGGYSDEPGVRPSVRPSVRLSVNIFVSVL